MSAESIRGQLRHSAELISRQKDLCQADFKGCALALLGTIADTQLEQLAVLERNLNQRCVDSSDMEN